MVSTATGMNEYDCVSGAYLAIFLFAAASAVAPDDSGRYDCAIVRITVISHVTHLPLFHGINATSVACRQFLTGPTALDCRDVGLSKGAPEEVVHAVMTRGLTSDPLYMAVLAARCA